LKILVISPSIPAPVSGGRTRVFNLIKQLSERHEISSISFLRPSDKQYVGLIKPFCDALVLVETEDFASAGKWRNRALGWSQILFSSEPRYVRTFPVEEMREPLRHLLDEKEFDVVVFEQLFLVELLPELNDLPTLLIEQNVESDIAARRMAQASNPVHKLRDRLNWQRLVQFERHWLSKFPVCVAVSQKDADRIKEIASGRTVIVVPNGVDTAYFSAKGGDRDPDTVLFFGSLSYEPNIDGLIWFCSEIWPHVRSALPGAVFEIVGLRPGPRISPLADLPGVRLTGFVKDIRQKLWSSTITAVPLRRGGGTRLKILEAMAASCPIVSTTIGAEGLEVEDDKHLYIADTQKEFVDKTIALLQSPEKRSELARAGSDLVAKEYDWKALTPRLEYAMDKAIEVHKSTIP
jgi:glycosyltransferase involved in cell wall biosynthesis